MKVVFKVTVGISVDGFLVVVAGLEVAEMDTVVVVSLTVEEVNLVVVKIS